MGLIFYIFLCYFFFVDYLILVTFLKIVAPTKLMTYILLIKFSVKFLRDNSVISFQENHPNDVCDLDVELLYPKM